MNNIKLPENFNYIAVFLTFSCQLRCKYCINHHGGDLVKGRKLTPKEWINGLNRIEARDIPITIQGGEPTTYKGFYEVINGIKRETSIDLLTNLEVDIKRFTESISPERFNRKAPYASIRVSYHHGQSDFIDLCYKVCTLRNLGYNIGVFEVDHPDYHEDVVKRKGQALGMGIDWRIKEFLGPWRGENHGTFRYENAVNNPILSNCLCRTSELLIDPAGYIFRCHSDLYSNRYNIGNILDFDSTSKRLGMWDTCNVYGKCNSCDIKVKNNRFQQFGHSSVEVINIEKTDNKNDTYQREVINTYGKH